ncbi:MAG: hypothetical protein U0235_33915 [Polyangiaceae bacterium]
MNVLDGATGLPIPGAKVVVGDSLGTGILSTTGANGAALVSNASLSGRRSPSRRRREVAISPSRTSTVPVDTVTAYLPPVIDLVRVAR